MDGDLSWFFTYVAAVVARKLEGEFDGLFDDEEEELQQGMAVGLELKRPASHAAGDAVLDMPELEEGPHVVLEGAVEGGRVAPGAEHLELEHLVAPLPLAEAAEIELRHIPDPV